MKKEDRLKLFHKYGGRCAYCGCELTKGWHADHANPVERKKKRIGGDYVLSATGEPLTESHFQDGKMPIYERTKSRLVLDGFNHPENDTLENMMPSCARCNNYKSSMTIEEFRKQLGLIVSRLNDYTSNYRTAKRFGLVEETDKKVKFYFETISN